MLALDTVVLKPLEAPCSLHHEVFLIVSTIFFYSSRKNETIKGAPLRKLHKVSKVLLANAMFLILASLKTLLFLLTSMVVVTSTAN